MLLGAPGLTTRNKKLLGSLSALAEPEKRFGAAPWAWEMDLKGSKDLAAAQWVVFGLDGVQQPQPLDVRMKKDTTPIH